MSKQNNIGGEHELMERIEDLQFENEKLKQLLNSFTGATLESAIGGKIHHLPDWYRLPTTEPGYRFLGQTELPWKGCQQWIHGEWGGAIEWRGYLWPDIEKSVQSGEGRYLFRVKI